jgi:hypothetical protein
MVLMLCANVSAADSGLKSPTIAPCQHPHRYPRRNQQFVLAHWAAQNQAFIRDDDPDPGSLPLRPAT